MTAINIVLVIFKISGGNTMVSGPEKYKFLYNWKSRSEENFWF